MTQRYPLMLTLLMSIAFCAVAQDADAPTDGPAAADDQSWKPDTPQREYYRDIVDYNIFQADRAAIARRVEADRNPPPPEPRDNPPPPPPKHPDFDRVLVGVTLRGEETLAFIEDRRDENRVTSVVVPGDYAEGRLVSIDPAGVVYRVDGEDRRIDVGSNLRGEAIAMTPTVPRERSEAPAAEPRAEEPPARSNREGGRDFGNRDFSRFRERGRE